MSTKNVCGCDEANRLRAELAIVTAERDYLLEFADPKEVRAMRLELADDHERVDETGAREASNPGALC
jgi:hypothetical protein